MAKITQAEIDDLKKAKKILESLQQEMSGSGSASDYLSAVSGTGTAFGDLAGNGQKIGEFIRSRHEAVNKALVVKGTPAVATAIGLLQTTITNYETNEKTQKGNADATPAGKSGGGVGGGGSTPQEGTG